MTRALLSPRASGPPASLAAYRRLVRSAFDLVAQGAAADPSDCRDVLAALAEMESDLGERAHHVLDAEARRWREKHGKCPWCGGEPVHEGGDP